MARGVRTVADLRKALGTRADEYSDEELLGAIAASTGEPIEHAAEKYGYDNNSGPWKERMSSSVDRYQAGLYGVGEAVADKAGLDSSFFGRRRRANEISAGISGTRSKEGGIPDDWRDVDGVGSGIKYVGGLAIDSAPYMAEAAAGGIAGRLLRGGAAAAMAGGAIASYPSSVGDVLGNQREEGGPVNLGAAAALGAPYAALNGVLGLESLAARTALPRVVSPVLDNVGGVRGRLARAGATGVQTAVSEGASEVGQEMLNQLGRMSVNEQQTFLNEESKKRYIDSFVGGAALGGAFGAGLSGGRRSEHARGDASPLSQRSDLQPEVADGSATQNLLALPYDPGVGGAINPVVNPSPFYGGPGVAPATSEADAFNARMAPQAGTPERGAPLTFDATSGAPVAENLLTPRVEPAGLVFQQVDPTEGMSLAPQEQAPTTTAPGIDFDTAFDTGNLALAPASSQDGPAPAAAPTGEAPAPVQHSGTPEAIARIEETRARKVAATDAIARAQEAGMASEKQQALFWRAEELAKEQKLPESKMTQVTALLMQSKFGQVKTMLDEAAAGQPDAEGQAVVKHVTKTVDQLDKEIQKEKLAQAGLIDKSKEQLPTVAKTMKAAAKDIDKRIQALEAERAEIVKHATKQAGVTATPAITPAAPQTAPVAEATPAPAESAAAPTITGSALKGSSEKASKIQRLEALLACLTR